MIHTFKFNLEMLGQADSPQIFYCSRELSDNVSTWFARNSFRIHLRLNWISEDFRKSFDITDTCFLFADKVEEYVNKN